jgi:F-type H+-transporting ATPase subunit epsilon
MKLLLLTPRGATPYDKIDEIILPTTLGEIAVLPRHEKLITELAPGTISVKIGGETKHFASFGGFAKITGGEVKVFSAGMEQAESLDEAKIQESIKRAREIKETATADVEFAAAAAAIERELAKLKTIKRHRDRI